MQRLRERDFRLLLEFLRGLYAPRDLNAFVSHVLSTLPKVIPSELTSYNEMIPEKGASANWTNPADYCTPAVNERWKEVMHEHPVLAYNKKTHDGRALKVSDFFSRKQLHSMAIYREHYRPMGAEDNLNAGLDNTGAEIVGIALHRGGPEFSERERLILDLLRPHLTQAWHNARVLTQAQQNIAQIFQTARVLEALDCGMIVLGPDARVKLANSVGRQYVAEYFGALLGELANSLPEALSRWVKHQESFLFANGEAPPALRPLVVEREGRRLVVRFLLDADQRILLLREQYTNIQPEALRPLGLNQRETEVLYWVAQGKTDAEIGTILDLSTRTVQKHLEHIFQKLGVETRTAAAAKAYEIASIPSPSPSPRGRGMV